MGYTSVYRKRVVKRAQIGFSGVSRRERWAVRADQVGFLDPKGCPLIELSVVRWGIDYPASRPVEAW